MNSTKKLSFAALLVAFSFAGAQLKIMGSIALDSLPAFLGALLLGPFWGAAIGAIGHFLTALTSGFPFGLPAHLLISVMMALTMAAFYGVSSVLKKKISLIAAYAFAGIVAVMINGPLDILALYPLLGPVMGASALWALIPVLSLVAAINVAMAIFVYLLLPKSFKSQMEVTRVRT